MMCSFTERRRPTIPTSPTDEIFSPEGVKQVVAAFRKGFPDLEGTLEDQTA